MRYLSIKEEFDWFENLKLKIENIIYSIREIFYNPNVAISLIANWAALSNI